MTQHDSVRAQLHAIEALLRQHQLWQETAPQPEAFASTQPFARIRWPLSSGCSGC